MDYKELAVRLRRRYLHSLENVDWQKPADVYYDCNQASTAIIDLLVRAEAAEFELDQREGYYDQMIDALAAVDSKELEEARKKLKVAEARAEKYKAFVDDVAGKPGCNTCTDQECPYRPNPGELTRFNCPLWCGPEDKRRNEHEKTDNG